MAGSPGALTEKMKAKAKKLWDDGVPAADIGERFGVSKSTILGIAHRGEWSARAVSTAREPATLFTRLAAEHAKMDAVLAIPPPRRFPAPPAPAPRR